MPNKTIRRSIAMTPEMYDRLQQVVSNYPRDTTEADLIRDAIQGYLDQREDLIGSRRHFQRTLRERIDALETTLTFQINVVLLLLDALVADRDQLPDAIIAAKREGTTLLAQMRAVRELSEDEA